MLFEITKVKLNLILNLIALKVVNLMKELTEIEYLRTDKDSLVKFHNSWTGRAYDPNWIIDILDWQRLI